MQQTYSRITLRERTVLIAGGIALVSVLSVALIASGLATGGSSSAEDFRPAAAANGPSADSVSFDLANQNSRQNPALAGLGSQRAASAGNYDLANQNPRQNPALMLTNSVTPADDDLANQNPRQNPLVRMFSSVVPASPNDVVGTD